MLPPLLAQADRAEAWRESLNLFGQGLWVVLTICFACLAVAYYFFGALGRYLVAELAVVILLVIVEPRLLRDPAAAMDDHQSALLGGEATNETVLFYILWFLFAVLLYAIAITLYKRARETRA